MRLTFTGVLAVLLMVGCSNQPSDNAGTAEPDGDGAGQSSTDPAPGQSTPASGMRTIELTPENTNIEFVCAHVGEKPDPRKGGFEQFSGSVQTDPATSAVASIRVEIDTSSLRTEIEKLTNHLKSPDFFDVREHPTAVFESSSIAAGEEPGAYTVSGNLTLHGVTREISFPATIDVTETGFALDSSFTIDRTEFGMDYGLDRVEKEVTLKVEVEA